MSRKRGNGAFSKCEMVILPMPSEQEKDLPILVEFSAGPGLQRVSLSPQDLVEKSKQALDKSASIIRAMAERISDVREAMPSRPDEVTVQFGIKFDAEVGALIAKSGVEASINLTLVWKE
ncbi:MAG: hypothetical protein KAU50_09660 [Candidatus Marinimicrobia bacterium]|nr:hypothetical protein [Candidatus Neomarinimicrobiota bacterium]